MNYCEKPNSKKATILLVDDFIQNIELLGKILKPEYDLQIALNGPSALAIAQSSPPP